MAFEHKTETEARQQILDMVAEYCDTCLLYTSRCV